MAEKIKDHIWSTTPAIAENIKQLQDKINELIDEINELKVREGKYTHDECGLGKHDVNQQRELLVAFLKAYKKVTKLSNWNLTFINVFLSRNQ